METNQIDPPTDVKADAVSDRFAELGDYVRDLRRAVEHERDFGNLEDACADVNSGTIRAEVPERYQWAIDSLIDAIVRQMRFSPDRHDRSAAGCMVSCIEAILERDAGERR